MSRRSLVWQVAPPAPPCFSDRLIWLEFLTSAAEEQRPGQLRVLVFEKGQPVRFNHHYPFCDACSAAHQQAMENAGRCWPWWLIDLQPEPEDAHAA